MRDSACRMGFFWRSISRDGRVHVTYFVLPDFRSSLTDAGGFVPAVLSRNSRQVPLSHPYLARCCDGRLLLGDKIFDGKKLSSLFLFGVPSALPPVRFFSRRVPFPYSSIVLCINRTRLLPRSQAC